MKKRNALVLIIFAFLLASCTVSKTKTSTLSSTKSLAIDPTHNSSNSLDWAGTYRGLLPCADCEGIENLLALHADGTYQLNTIYKGKRGDFFTESGTFSWNKVGNTIQLSEAKNRPGQYFVGENHLVQLDMKGEKITGDLAEKYVLKKQIGQAADTTPMPNASIVETYWKLIEIQGAPVLAKDSNRMEIHIILKTDENRFMGFAGCNRIFGKYELTEGNHVSFSGVASTLMACPEMEMEEKVKKALEMVDNYSINGNQLMLAKARMAPLARFEAVYLK